MTQLGILGGGLIARLMTQAASSLGLQTTIYTTQADQPAAQVTPYVMIAAGDDGAALERFARQAQVITIEAPTVDVATLRQLEAWGAAVYPAPDTLALMQDQLLLRRTLQAAGVALPRFRSIQSGADVMEAAGEYGFPLHLKARQPGASQRASVVIRRSHDVPGALTSLQGMELYAEAQTAAVRDLVVLVARDRQGAMQFYPVVEREYLSPLGMITRCPAGIDEATAYKAVEQAKLTMEALRGVGVFSVALYELEDGEVLVNAVTPHPDEAGHYTIEGIITSQYENHVRAILGWPLGDVPQIAPATATVPIQGDRPARLQADFIRDALAVEGAHIHLYGWSTSEPGRPLGHITVLGYSTDGAEKVARLAHSRLRW